MSAENALSITGFTTTNPHCT